MGEEMRAAGRQRLSLLPLFLILLAPPPALALRFDLQSDHTKCIAEDIRVNAMSVGKYSVVNPNAVEGQQSPPLSETHRVNVRVTSPHGNSIHYADNVDSGNFAFTATEDGDYLACFWSPDHKPTVTMTVEFDWRTGVAAKEWPNVVKKGQIDCAASMMN